MARFEYESQFGSAGTGDGEFNLPFDCTISNSRLFVSDTGNNRIQVFNLLNTFLYEFGSAGTGDGEFDAPKGIYAYNSEIYVLDSGNKRVQVFDLDGVFLREFDGSTSDEFNDAEFISGKGNEIYVSDRLNYQIQVFNLDGNFLRKFGTYGIEPGQFQATSGIAVNGDNLYIGDEKNQIDWFLVDGIWKGPQPWTPDGIWKTV